MAATTKSADEIRKLYDLDAGGHFRSNPSTSPVGEPKVALGIWAQCLRASGESDDVVAAADRLDPCLGFRREVG